jgi:hypothetical protein
MGGKHKMRFLALLRKELRESLPWILLTVILLLTVGAYMLRMEAYYNRHTRYLSRLSPGVTLDPYTFAHYSVLQVSAVWLVVISIGLGLVLGVRHFGIPFFTRTWPFLLHRSTGRMTILTAKLTAATIAIVVSLGTTWLVIYLYACRPGMFTIPPYYTNLIDGWLFTVLGLVVYLATALSALSTARWYTTKIFGLALVTIVIFVMTVETSRPWIIVITIFTAAILLSQIIHIFLTREF